MNRPLHHAAFATGLAAVAWIAFGYLGAHPLALALTLLVGAFYLMGAVELHRFRQATLSLDTALAGLDDTPPSLADWLSRLPPSLQTAVRLRIDGERVGLPGPALTPYLAGLLVLLGMLGTFLGMVVTLDGTGAALDGARDVAAIRASLAAPVKGLGLAFGTSVAGVAASAMLGLMSALCRRERTQVAQRLETRIAGPLRAFSRVFRQEQARAQELALLQQQAALMPALVDQLKAMMDALARQGQSLDERLLAGHADFHAKAEAAYEALAASVDRSLKDTLGDSARLAAAAIQPMAEATMAGIAREAAALHQGVAAQTQALHQGVAAQTQALQAGVAETVQQQLTALSSRIETAQLKSAQAWTDALAQQQRSAEAVAQQLQQALGSVTEGFAQRAADLVAKVDRSQAELVARTATSQADVLEAVGRSQRDLLDTVGSSQTTLLASLQAAQSALSAGLGASQAELLATLQRSQAELQASLVANDAQRLAAWTEALQASTGTLQAQAQAHARDTITEVKRFAEVAAQAPLAAAEAMAALRQQLSDSLVRDNAVLDERNRLLATLDTLLGAVNRASSEQRAAIDALLATTAQLLERVGTQFTEHVQAETGKLTGVAAQVTGSAVEVASLGEAFGAAVQLFSQSSEQMGAQLQRVEAALGKSMARSDEQLAYYVAQAREIIDLSLSAQKQVIEDLQRLGAQRSAEAAETTAA